MMKRGRRQGKPFIVKAEEIQVLPYAREEGSKRQRFKVDDKWRHKRRRIAFFFKIHNFL